MSQGWVDIRCFRMPGIDEGAQDEAMELLGEDATYQMCRENPRLVALGRDLTAGPIAVDPPKQAWQFWRKAS